jgi:hypothetical protein
MKRAFLSYARSSSRADAVALYQELGGDAGGLAFLDTSDIEYRERFPERLIDALLGAELLVVFGDATYFTRWYCLVELRAGLAPYNHAIVQGDRDSGTLANALEGVLIARPRDAKALDSWRLPPELQDVNLPSVAQVDALAAVIRRRLERPGLTLGARLDATVGARAFRQQWLEVSRLPPVRRMPPVMPRVPPEGPPASLREGFVGRANDLWRIHDALTWNRDAIDTGAAATVSVEGGAGLGKTRLAIEYVHRLGAATFQGGLFWLDASRDLAPQYYAIARALEPNTTPEWTVVRREPDGVTTRMLDALRARASKANVLVVLDNVPDPAPNQPPPALQTLFPALGEVAVLVTSRSRVVAESDGVVTRLRLDVLEEDDATALLRREVDATALQPSEWQDIARWVGRLPLALVLLNRSIVAGAISPTELLQRSQQLGTTAVLDAAMGALRDVVPTGALRGVSEALGFSYDRLSTPAQHAARLLAWLAPTPIPAALINVLDRDSFTGPIRALLTVRSIVTPVAQGPVPMFGEMHRVMADFLRTRTTREEIRSELNAVANAMFAVMNAQQVRIPAEWPLMDACLPHAGQLLFWLTSQRPRTPYIDATAAVGFAVMGLLMAQRLETEAAKVGSNIWPSLGEPSADGHLTLDGARPAVLGFNRMLTSALAQSGNLDAAIGLQQVLVAALERNLTDDDPQLMTERDNLSLYLTNRAGDGDLAEASRLYDTTLPVWRRIAAGSSDLMAVLYNKALLEGKRDNGRQAQQLFEEVVAGMSQLPPAIETVQAHVAFAESLWDADRDRSLEELRRALAVAESLQLPDQHPLKIVPLERLGERARLTGDFPTAVLLLTRVVDVRSSSNGDTNDGTATRAWALFDAALRAGDMTAVASARSHLAWMMNLDDSALTDAQRRIRADVTARVTADPT